MAPDRARASYKIRAHSLSVSHEFLERLVPSFQPLADLLKALGCGCLDLTARLAKHQPHCVFGHCDPLLFQRSFDRITLVQADHLTRPPQRYDPNALGSFAEGWLSGELRTRCDRPGRFSS